MKRWKTCSGQYNTANENKLKEKYQLPVCFTIRLQIYYQAARYNYPQIDEVEQRAQDKPFLHFPQKPIKNGSQTKHKTAKLQRKKVESDLHDLDL